MIDGVKLIFACGFDEVEIEIKTPARSQSDPLFFEEFKKIVLEANASICSGGGNARDVFDLVVDHLRGSHEIRLTELKISHDLY